MRSLKLVQHMKTNEERMSEGWLERVRKSNKCQLLLMRVPADEHRRYALGVYRELTRWLASESEADLDQHHVDVGMKRAQQSVPFSDLFWAITIAREFLWEYTQQESLLEEPVEFWGGVDLLHSVNRFFDRALYCVLLGYQKAGKGEFAGTTAKSA